ncbi:MAG: dephospho-CoA kinase [Halanaerobiales bacterium]
MIIGLTGGIASGKSTVSSILDELGAALIDSDKLAHDVLKDKSVCKKIVESFGKQVLNEDGEINRSSLGEIVFNDPEKRKDLENITHPVIISRIHKKIEEYEKENRNIVLDAPLLFEANLDRIVDQTWVVYVDKKTQIKRLMSRNGMDYEKAKARVESQMPLKKKKKMADVVIDNMGSISQLKEDVIKRWRDFCENKKNSPDCT